MGKLAFWFIVALVLVSMFSTLAAYFYYTWLKASGGNELQVAFETEGRKNGRNRVYLQATLEGAFRPILGYVKGRLYYDDNVMTERFSLLTNKRLPRSFRRTAIAGKSRLYLPDVKEYELKGGFVYFQDMLHIFSLAVSQPLSGHFYQPPELSKGPEDEVSPKKTENLDVRIEQLRRVDGEYLNYKDFESGDDVRRIVWKVYAKNRDLVVRVPEMFEPYASHLHMYASFYGEGKLRLSNAYAQEMLNYYKNCVWTVFDTLSKKEWEVKYIADQAITLPDQLAEPDRVAKVITGSNWHADKNLLSYFSPKTGAVLCVSSFTDVDQLAELLEVCDPSTVIYFVKLSGNMRSLAPLTWVFRLLLQPPKDRLSRLRSTWAISPFRFQVQKRERAIESVLKSSNVKWGVV